MTTVTELEDAYRTGRSVCRTKAKGEEHMSIPNSTVKVLNEGNSAIVVDDHCYVIKNLIDGEWVQSAWIFQEALDALKQLPDNPDEAKLKGKNA